MNNYKPKVFRINISNFYPIAYYLELSSLELKADLYADYDQLIEDIKNQYQIEDIINLPKIKTSRDGYKRLHIDPSRYRLSCESLYRRIVKGYGINHIHPLVDAGNMISLLTQKSVCVADYDQIKGDITLRIGQKEEIYETINRGIIKVDNMPLYCDDLGPFGNMTSDTKRTMVSPDTKSYLVMITSFTESDLREDEDCLLSILNKYFKIKHLEKLTR